MVARIDLAWRILQIAALALPALAILVQVLLQMNRKENDSTPHYYRVSAMMLFLLVPMTGVGLIASGVLFVSYEVTWLRLATALMGSSFLFIPIFLYVEYRGNHNLFKNHFLEREKEAIEDAAESGEMDEDIASAEIEKIESWQGGLLTWSSWRSGRLKELADRYPKLDLAVSSVTLIWGLYVIISLEGVLTKILGVPIVLFAIARIGSYFVDLPTEGYE